MKPLENMSAAEFRAAIIEQMKAFVKLTACSESFELENKRNEIKELVDVLKAKVKVE